VALAKYMARLAIEEQTTYLYLYLSLPLITCLYGRAAYRRGGGALFAMAGMASIAAIQLSHHCAPRALALASCLPPRACAAHMLYTPTSRARPLSRSICNVAVRAALNAIALPVPEE